MLGSYQRRGQPALILHDQSHCQQPNFLEHTAALLPRSVKYRSMPTNKLPIDIFCGTAVCCAIHCGCRAMIWQGKCYVLEGWSCVMM